MIDKYKCISIIYGASGRACAIRMHEELQRLHVDEFYPVKPYILADEILNASSILDTVKDIISRSTAAIVILTFDDMDNTRVRQNVLVELGIALTLIEQQNCFFISERQKLPEDFPSDLQNVVNPNYFDKNDPDSVVKSTCRALIKHLGIKNYQDILSRDDYEYDYKRVLDDIPYTVFEKKADVQLEHILTEWENNLRSFEFVVERVMYLLERIKFFPDFNCNERFFAFLANVESMIRPSELDYKYYDRNYLIHTCQFVTQILEYSRIKLNKQVLACLADPAAHPQEIKRYKAEFKGIADDLRDFIDAFEDGTYHYNWLIRVMAYEYTALAYMKYLVCLDRYDDSILELMKYIISCYEKVIRVGKRNDPFSHILWQGYAQYDLTRAYENLYKITGDESYFEKMEDYSQASIATRYRWFCENPFKGVFSSALSYEYFLVCRHEYELRFKYPHYSPDTDNEILVGLGGLKEELSRFCETTGLGRLYDMRDSIDQLMNNVTGRK